MKGITASFYREYKIRISSPRIFVENIANPIFILLIFGLTIGNTMGTMTSYTEKNISYINFFVIGAINISLISNALVAATKMFLDKYIGLYEEFLSYPVKRSDILLGKLAFNLLLSLIQSIIMMSFVQIITGFSGLNFYKSILLLLLSVIGSSTWFFSMMIMAIKLKTQDAFNTMYFLIMTPIIFTSSIYYPINKMPYLLRIPAYINPLSWLTDIGRYIYIGMPTEFLIFKVIGIIAILIISSILSIRLFNKA